jgi:hypothetical protein
VYGTNLGAAVADPQVLLGCSTQTIQSAPTGP